MRFSFSLKIGSIRWGSIVLLGAPSYTTVIKVAYDVNGLKKQRELYMARFCRRNTIDCIELYISISRDVLPNIECRNALRPRLLAHLHISCLTLQQLQQPVPV